MTEMEQQDQTVFSSTQPLFDIEPRLPINPEEVPTKKSKKIVLIGAVIALLIVFILALLILWSLKPKITPDDDLEASPAPATDLVTDPVFDRLNQLKEDLDQADPTNRDLPFPPVNMEIGFDENI